MKPRALTTMGSGWVSGVHAKCFHLHFDIDGERTAVEEYLKPFLHKYTHLLKWDPFFLPSMEGIRDLYHETYTIEDSIAQVLCDPASYGAPQMHLSAQHFHGDPYKDPNGEGAFAFRHLLQIYEEGCALLRASPFSGYVEVEDAHEELLLPAKPRTLPAPELPAIDMPRFQMVPLTEIGDLCASNDVPEYYRETGKRWFRATEIHISFQDVRQTDPRVILRLLEFGFYSAYKEQANGNIKFIATIQGFEHEICRIRTAVITFLTSCPVRNSIASRVSIKKEDISHFFVFGNRPALQRVASPQSHYFA